MNGMHMEYRAVFSYPPSYLGPTPDDYGPWRKSLKETEQDRPFRPEESYGRRTGTQKRFVTDPEDIDA